MDSKKDNVSCTEVGLCAQNMNSVLSSFMNTAGRPYVIMEQQANLHFWLIQLADKSLFQI